MIKESILKEELSDPLLFFISSEIFASFLAKLAIIKESFLKRARDFGLFQNFKIFKKSAF